MPIVGQLTSKFQARYIIAFGWLCVALAMFYSTTRLNLLINFGTAAWIRTVQVVGLGFLFVPITLTSYVGIPPEKSNAVSGLINFMRNMGSSVGTSMVTTMIARRSQYHQTVLVGNASLQNPTFLNAVDALSGTLTHSGLGAVEAQRLAHERLYQTAQNQAATLAYIDTFWILGVVSVIMFILSFALKKNVPGQSGGAEAAV
jgi:DHA2 family multidrug resistance protein